MFNRKPKRADVQRLDRVALTEILQLFEDDYAERYGNRITTAEFYDRYLAGEMNAFPEAIRWASYYELLREQGQSALMESNARSVVV
jgi:hypothetical protein